MSKNPCKDCENSYLYKGRHYKRYSKECFSCEKRKKHEAYLESKRMYVPGEPVTDIYELEKQTFVYWHGLIKHRSILMSLQCSCLLEALRSGNVLKAVLKESKDDQG